VGNLSVGGAGKTPLVAHIALLLLRHGYRPGIISRGYKGAASQWPQTVTAASDPAQVGDEPVLLATLTRCVVIAGPTGTPDTADVYSMALLPGKIYSLKDGTIIRTRHLCQQPLHAVAGIGRPARFFDTLRLMGLTIIEHAFDDHHPFCAKDLEFDDEYDLITTEKDAIKLTGIPATQIIWVLPVVAKPGEPFDTDLLNNLRKL
jgi:tetraacyldisaccharide-1-P 4'-kinase